MSIDATQMGLGLGAIQSKDKTANLVDADKMGRDEFLTLLVAQIENQDPLSPQANHEFVAQLATFSSLEQQVQTNTNLENLQMDQKSMANGQLSTLIGKSIQSAGKSLSIDRGIVPPVNLELASPADSVTITVLDEAGQAVSVIERGALGAGPQSIAWDGFGTDGVKLPDGKYSLQVSAKDASGNPVTVGTKSDGRVLGVTFENGYPELILDSGRILPSEIISINEAPPILPPYPADQGNTDTQDENDGANTSTNDSGQGSQSETSDHGETMYGAAYSQLRRYAPPVFSGR